jgi:hypothetical protein
LTSNGPTQPFLHGFVGGFVGGASGFVMFTVLLLEVTMSE